jgi:Cu-Zn family superoxide dismutase
MKNINKYLFAFIILMFTNAVYASLLIPVHLTEGNTDVGNVKVDNSQYGLILTPDLHGLPPGTHGFHVHAMAMCNHDGMAAGGHLDPKKTNQHRGPYNNQGHLGDLPALMVDANGRATVPVLAPRLKLASIKNKALMIHAGGDNYSDAPEKLGGGGARLACGIIPS